MKTIHFTYTIPTSANPFLYRFNNFAKKTNYFAPAYRSGNDALISWPKPIYAPHSITYHLLHTLKKKYKIKLYDWRENTVCKMADDDIFLGHPSPDFSDSTFIKPDPKSVVTQTLKKFPEHKRIIINPYTNLEEAVGWIKPLFSKKEEKFIAICGEIWTRNWETSPFYGLVNNPLQVNMAIDPSRYPFLKTKFNPKQQRKFLYIGNTSTWKNIEQLEKIANTYKGFQGGYISKGEINGWNKIADYADLTPEFMSNLAREYDFFLNTSRADAQATTILEQMCMGFGIACTPESGYEYDSIIKLDKHDTDYNCHQLEMIQQMDEEEIVAFTKINREIVEKEHNWEIFCKKVLAFIEA